MGGPGIGTVHAVVSLGVWLLFYVMFFGIPHITALLLPAMVFPVLFFTMGLSWALASLGVYLRDVSQVVGIVTTVLMFLSPVFYPISALPNEFRFLMYLNPLTLSIEQARAVLFWGTIPDPGTYGLYLAMSMIFSWVGFAWFQKTRKGFADVI